MLPPAKVIPLLLHEDRLVRELALRYLAKAHDPSPATADDFWAAIDRHGAGEHRSFVHGLANMPQTESSLLRALKELTRKDRDDPLEKVIANLHYGLLMRFRDDIEQTEGLSDKLRGHLAKRFELATAPPIEMWEQLMALGAQEAEPEPLAPERLIEALSRSPESAGWAINMLADLSEIDMRHVYAVEVLGRLRHRQSARLIADALAADLDADFLIEASTEALARIGSPEVVQILRDRFGSLDWGLQLHAADTLGRIKLAGAETALVHCLRHASDKTVRTEVAAALCAQFTTDQTALDLLTKMIASGDWDSEMLELNEDVAGLFTALGRPVPHGPTPPARYAFASPAPAAKLDWDEASDTELLVPPAAAPPIAASTIRRAAPKVGRNDPCPCGSGRKFKKCCGK